MLNYQVFNDFLCQPDSDHNRLLKPFFKKIFQNFPGSILDVGCGTGFLASALAEFKFGNNYTGIDLESQAIDFCKELNLPANFQFERTDSWKTKPYDLAVFCLCFSEMDSLEVKKYLASNLWKQVLIIDPSDLTFYYPTKITKAWVSKIFTRFGHQANWQVLSNPSAVYNQQKYELKIQGNPSMTVPVYRRTVGDMLNLLTTHDWQFLKYWNLEFQENSRHIAPISKFTAILAKKNDQQNKP